MVVSGGISVTTPEDDYVSIGPNMEIIVSFTNLKEMTVKFHIDFSLQPSIFGAFSGDIYQYEIFPNSLNLTLAPMKTKDIKLNIIIITKYSDWNLLYKINGGRWNHLCHIHIEGLPQNPIPYIGTIYKLCASIYLIIQLIISVLEVRRNVIGI